MRRPIIAALIAVSATCVQVQADPAATEPALATSPSALAPQAAPANPTPSQTTSPTTTPPAATKPAPQRQEDTYAYTSGFSDGCASANLRYARQEHVKPNRDPKLYETDADYHAGWDHGYRKCEDKITPGGLSVPGNSVIM